MLSDVAEQLRVEEDDEEHWDAVGVDEDGAHEGASALVLGQEVEGAGGQVALCNRNTKCFNNKILRAAFSGHLFWISYQKFIPHDKTLNIIRNVHITSDIASPGAVHG